MKFSHLFFLLLITTSACSKADTKARPSSVDRATSQPLALSTVETAAMDRLLKTDMFSDPFVGFTGGPSQEVVAFVTLLKTPGADAAFHDLYRRAAHPAGKLYALCGFWFTDQEAFTKGVDEMKASKATTQTVSGCIISMGTVGDVVQKQAPFPPRVVLNGPDDTIEAWLKRQSAPPDSYVLDIAGGGQPAVFGELRKDPRFDLHTIENLP